MGFNQRRNAHSCLVFSCAATFLVLLLASSAHALTSINRWSDPATWSRGIPQAGDNVVIPQGMTVLLDVDPPPLGNLSVRGSLIFDTRDTSLTCRRINVHNGGVFQIGSSAQPMLEQVVITLTGDITVPAKSQPRTFMVMPGGRLELHGRPYSHSWTHLDTTGQAGDSIVHLAEQVNWPAGKEVVITSTDFDLDQAERRTIEDAPFLPAGALQLDAPLDFMHWGEISDGVDERAEIALLGRTIVIQGDDTSPATQIGGHMMFMNGGIFMNNQQNPPVVHIDWVEVNRMGWVGKLGRYPVHFHHAQSVAGSYVTNTSIHDCYNRAITIHDTHDLFLSGNISCETIGHAFYLEDGNETGNRIENNLGLLTRIPEPGMEVDPETDIYPATFYISNNQNIVEGNVAAGSEGDGFWYHVPPTEWGNLFAFVYGDPPTFNRNTAHSNGRHGYFQDDRVFLQDGQFLDFTAYKNNHYGVWARTYGTANWINARLADNGGGIYPATEGIIHTDTIQGIIVIGDSLFVGETDNIGTPQSTTEILYGRSLPEFWGEGPNPTNELAAIGLYDGLIVTVNSTFKNYQGALIANQWRNSGAFTPVSYESPWCVDPRNAVLGCTFVNANPIYFRQWTLGANGVANTALLDYDGCITGVAGSTIIANNEFLDPLAGSEYVPEYNAHVIGPEYAYAQLVLYNGDFVNPLPAWAPDEIEIGLGFNGSTGPTNPSVGLFDNSLVTYNAFPANVLLDGEYEVILPEGTAVDDFIVSLRFAAPGSSVIVQIPCSTPPTDIQAYEFSLYGPLHGIPSFPAVLATDLDDLRNNPLVNAWYDQANGWLYLKPTLGNSFFNPKGTTVFDGSMVYFLVTH